MNEWITEIILVNCIFRMDNFNSVLMTIATFDSPALNNEFFVDVGLFYMNTELKKKNRVNVWYIICMYFMIKSVQCFIITFNLVNNLLHVLVCCWCCLFGFLFGLISFSKRKLFWNMYCDIWLLLFIRCFLSSSLHLLSSWYPMRC